MRPLRITMEGFASFADRTVIDLTDVDLFALEGRTGAGKSSVIDAITFALYGRAHRYDARQVSPLLSQSCGTGFVALEFAVGDHTWRAVRVLARTKKSANTKEARLELVRDDGTAKVEAASPRSVTDRVGEILGLDFDQFCKVVVLPQGAFAEFLRSTGKERADLLVEILGVDIYRVMGSAARVRNKAAQGRVDIAHARLEPLEGATPEAIKAVHAEIKGYEAADGLLADAAEDLDAIKARGTIAAQERDTATADVDAVAALAIPDGVDTLAAEAAAAKDQIAVAEKARRDAVAASDTLESALAGMPALDRMQRVVDLRAGYKRMVEQGRALKGQAETAGQDADNAQKALDDADRLVAEARESHDALKATGHAHRLLAGLHAGDDCPTCQRPLDTDPAVPADAEIAAAAKALADAEQTRQAASAHRDSRVREHAALEARLTTARDEAMRAKADVAEAEEAVPSSLRDDPDALGAALTERRAAQQEWEAVRGRVRQADAALDKARSDAETLDGSLAAAWKAIDAARDTVSRLGAPALARDDLGSDWKMLLDWAAEITPVLAAAKAAAQTKIDKVSQEYRERRQQLVDSLEGLGITLRTDIKEDPAAAVSRVRTDAAGRIARLRADAERAESLREEVTDAQSDVELTKEVGDLLASKGFERWLIDRVVARLVVTASARLKELSGGQYSLTTDDAGEFAVIDHVNADSVRTARSLSGGETFLTALALALALSDHVAAHSTQGTKIESLILDEGFGTLDADTLDTVAVAIEELGQSGKQVGIISHVRELTERIPHRIIVTRDHEGSKATVQSATLAAA